MRPVLYHFLFELVNGLLLRDKTSPKLTYDFFLPYMAGQPLEEVREVLWAAKIPVAMGQNPYL